MSALSSRYTDVAPSVALRNAAGSFFLSRPQETAPQTCGALKSDCTPPASRRQHCASTGSFHLMTDCREAGRPVHLLNKDEKAQLLKVMHALL